RKLPPTPEHFSTVYHEVAGTRPLKPFPLEHLRHIGSALPDQTPAQQRFKAQFGKAVTMHSWDDLEKALIQHLRQSAPSHERKDMIPVAVVEEVGLPPVLREQMCR
ncbi:hypothetical protein RZS08_57030, partial [Arthrospira platensis SPKY1]|nr:hypothetical protein [Arthrospira platensis SPKY1]